MLFIKLDHFGVSRDFCLLSNIMGLNGALNVVLTTPKYTSEKLNSNVFVCTYRVIQMQQKAVFWSCEVDGLRRRQTTFYFDHQPLGVVLRPEGDG